MKPLHILLVAGAFALPLATPAAAQTPDQTDNQAPFQSGRCQADPQNGQQKPPVNNDGSNKNSLSDTLDRCNGVLQPPPTGDQGLAAPPPDEGKTPVIKPGEVPAQPPKQ
ncbi:hypothetical protein [Mesorhizobium helmanticense]|uniref:Uncharacterized protein n=1 Tax=Mesorhizobium helmanticense TaxID=1776423 RepID=A0A2T4IQF1_9HYPH|nr:hypothetical protein [Mesorhizobium helmanticense]PTE07891.1 hypothetical protein C9427_24775 [Mesorhizobium helmanticense]